MLALSVCTQDIPGLTTDTVPRRLGPKRVGKIRKLYNLSKVMLLLIFCLILGIILSFPSFTMLNQTLCNLSLARSWRYHHHHMSLPLFTMTIFTIFHPFSLSLFACSLCLSSLVQEDDVRQYVIRRPLPLKEGKPQRYKAPKIQRLITPVRLQRKRHLLALKRKWGEKSRAEAAEYARLLARRAKEARDQRVAKRRLSSKKSSTSSM